MNFPELASEWYSRSHGGGNKRCNQVKCYNILVLQAQARFRVRQTSVTVVIIMARGVPQTHQAVGVRGF